MNDDEPTAVGLPAAAEGALAGLLYRAREQQFGGEHKRTWTEQARAVVHRHLATLSLFALGIEMYTAKRNHLDGLLVRLVGRELKQQNDRAVNGSVRSQVRAQMERIERASGSATWLNRRALCQQDIAPEAVVRTARGAR